MIYHIFLGIEFAIEISRLRIARAHKERGQDTLRVSPGGYRKDDESFRPNLSPPGLRSILTAALVAAAGRGGRPTIDGCKDPNNDQPSRTVECQRTFHMAAMAISFLPSVDRFFHKRSEVIKIFFET